MVRRLSRSLRFLESSSRRECDSNWEQLVFFQRFVFQRAGRSDGPAAPGSPRYTAYANLDDYAMDQAPWAVFGNAKLVDFFSSRMGCQTFSAVYQTDLTRLCLR